MEQRFFDRALQYISLGQFELAVEQLKQVLAEDPDSPQGHAFLAFCLLQQKRVYAAKHEAAIALTLEPMLPMAHFTMTQIQIAARQFKKAQEHLTILLEIEPEDPVNYLLQAELYSLTRSKTDILPLLEKAQSLDPENLRVKAALGRHFLSQGLYEKANHYAHEILEDFPDYQDGLTLKGLILLQQGNIEEAREHAMWALRQNPMDKDALYLISSIKARRNPLLGLWWRYNTWMSERGESRIILILIGAYFMYRAVSIYVEQLGYTQASTVIDLLWLGLCVYTWVSPGIFSKMLQKEFKKVTLKPEF